ncbi:MAG: TldD/PmbA family protein [bacterium]
MDHQAILKKALQKNIDQAEVYFSSSKSLQINVLNQKVESIEEVTESGLGIRVIKDKKLGFAYTSDLDEDVIEETIDQAIANARNTVADEYHELPKGLKANRPIGPLVDPSITTTSIQDKIKLALRIEESAYKSDKRVKKTEKISYSDSEGEVWIANSHGLDLTYKSNNCSADAEVIAIDGGMEMGFGMDFVKKLADLNPEKVGQEAAQRATELLGAKTIESQKLPIVLDPLVAVALLEVLISPLSSEAVQKGRSLFAGKIGEIVAAKILNIIDDGRLENGLATRPFDSEGVPTQETKLIENGKLNTFLFNTYTANKGLTESTGNAVRGGFSGRPGVGPSNFYIVPGSKTPNSILRTVAKGLYVNQVMGIHTANAISGEFSIGALGIMIENGKKTYPVKGITISGNLIDLLQHIEEVGSDLRFFGGAGAPTVLINNISISGE